MVLWTVSAELYSVEDLQAALRVGGKTLRMLLEFRGCLDALSQAPTPSNPTPVASAQNDRTPVWLAVIGTAT